MSPLKLSSVISLPKDPTHGAFGVLSSEHRKRIKDIADSWGVDEEHVQGVMKHFPGSADMVLDRLSRIRKDRSVASV